MLSKTITYEGHDGEKYTETHWFHISKAEIAELLPIREGLMKWRDRVIEAEKNPLSDSEKLEILNLLRTMVDLSFGVRSEDGKYFSKDEPEDKLKFRQFKNGGARDELLFSMFLDAEQIGTFLTGIVPVDAIERAQAQIDANGGDKSALEKPFDPNQEFSAAELQKLNKEQLIAAMAAKSERLKTN